MSSFSVEGDGIDSKGDMLATTIAATDEPEKKRVKRSRAIQTCSMCVRRKTKCDQATPCSACIKRGDPAGCVVELSEPATLGRSAWASRSELQELRFRFEALEAMVKSSLIPSDPSFSSYDAAGRNAIASTSSLTHSQSNTTPTLTPVRREDESTVAAVLQMLREGSAATPMGEAPIRKDSSKTVYANEDMMLESYTDEWAGLLQMLPTPEISALLVDSFFLRVDWHMHVLHTSMFREEHTRFWESQLIGARDYSASWLATYFMVISLGLYFLPSVVSPYSAQENTTLPIRWRDLSEKALTLADWSGTPQARCVQAILLMGFYWLNTGGIDRLVVWVGAAVRIAQALGLHTLDRNAILFPNDHFLIEYENLPFFSKELGSRLFWHLCIFDWDVSYRCRNIQVMSAQDFSTPTPLNLSDTDITRGSMSAKNPRQPTTVNYEIHLADLIFLQQQWVVPRKTASGLAILPLETIISIDKLVREKARKFSTFFRIDKSQAPDVVQVDRLMSCIPLQRLNLNMEIHCRLLRLHRRCLFDDSESVEALSSRNSSRHSSSQILAIAQEFRNSCDFASKLWWIDAYSILACVGLVASNIHLASLVDASSFASLSSDILARRHEVVDSVTAIRSSPTPPSSYTKEGLRVVELLLTEESNVCRSVGIVEGGKERAIKVEGASSAQRHVDFDAVAFRKIVDDAAKASLACAVDETKQMRKLADDLTRRSEHRMCSSTSVPAALLASPLVGIAASLLPPTSNTTTPSTTPSLPVRPLDPLVSAAAYVNDPFRSSNSSSLSLSMPNSASEYDDDFYRSLGFLPPVANPTGAREIADLFAGSYGGDAAMQDW